ncbi:HIT family protein [Thiocystis violacea]|uniref:HIT family protein n=1 Tax=Thiocystis violacea TaxID=13725 RepID=UPI001A917350|nr:HIT family protein [Thiocystis violacea]
MDRDPIDGFSLHPRLRTDTWPLGESAGTRLLLMNNALLPWLILVPKSEARELHRLEPGLRQEVRAQMDLICDFIEREFQPHKLNVATIGNLVPQLHIHLIGRYRNDVYWPAPVWGRQERRDYQTEEVERLRARVAGALGQVFALG